jgi:hypothetical protein
LRPVGLYGSFAAVQRMPNTVPSQFAALFLLSAATALFTGCKQDQVSSYEIPKEAPPPTMSPHGGSMPDPHAGMAMGRPSLEWGTLPDGWTEGAASGMRLATFNIKSPDGKSADMAIIPMGGFPGTDAQLVNMWRMQLGLPEVAEAEAGDASAPVTVGGAEGRQYTLVGKANDVPARMLVASVSKDGMHFFFKMTGDDTLVAAQQEAFREFLKTVEFGDATPPTASLPPAAATPASAATRWDAPAAWEVLPATQFLLAKYRVKGEGEAMAEVTVSQLGGAAGGMLPNVNRWRGQLNLPPVDQAELDKLIVTVKAGATDASLVRMNGTEMQKGTPARMLVVTVPLPDETWFFKMTGPVALVEAREAEFLGMVRSARF